MTMTFNSLSPEEMKVIENRGTEPPFTGEYNNFYHDGTYICRKCNVPLFSSKSKFDAGCGWPSFDKNFPNSILQIPDPDRIRMEIQCASCHGHLGHVFKGENMTVENTRHCVNSTSIRFIASGEKLPKVIHE